MEVNMENKNERIREYQQKRKELNKALDDHYKASQERLKDDQSTSGKALRVTNTAVNILGHLITGS
jgi:uncharacterized coiled-coil DUF342 family protein